MVQAWALMRGRIRLGTLQVLEVDQPWFRCRFEPTAAFADVRELFAEQQRCLDVEDWDGLEAAMQAIQARQVRLDALDGDLELTEFLLHIDGEHADLRY